MKRKSYEYIVIELRKGSTNVKFYKILNQVKSLSKTYNFKYSLKRGFKNDREE